jgi:putative transposase
MRDGLANHWAEILGPALDQVNEGGLAQPYSNTARDAPPVAVSRVGCCELSPGMFIGHSEIVAFLLYRSNADKPAPLLRRWILALYNHKLLSASSLGTPRARDLLLEVMEQIRQRHQFVVDGYVIMPEHVHLLFTEPERGNPSLVLAASKQTFAHRLLRELRANTGAKTEALWNTPVAVGHVWQRRFYDFVVFTEKKRVEKLRYMHCNPVQRGLVLTPEEWLWSSFRHYAYGEPGPVLVNETRKAKLRIRKIS